jgi:hypothetical protein
MNPIRRFAARIRRALTDAAETDAFAGAATHTGVGRNPILDQHVADEKQRKNRESD